MLHDPEMEVTCDKCDNTVYLQMNWTTGGYNLTDNEIKHLLDKDHGWKTDGDKHYCSSYIDVKNINQADP